MTAYKILHPELQQYIRRHARVRRPSCDRSTEFAKQPGHVMEGRSVGGFSCISQMLDVACNSSHVTTRLNQELVELGSKIILLWCVTYIPV